MGWEKSNIYYFVFNKLVGAKEGAVYSNCKRIVLSVPNLLHILFNNLWIYSCKNKLSKMSAWDERGSKILKLLTFCSLLTIFNTFTSSSSAIFNLFDKIRCPKWRARGGRGAQIFQNYDKTIKGKI